MYIDTSCLVAYYLPEEKSQLVQEKIQSTNEVIISQITDIEMLSAVKKKERMNEISSRDADNAFQLFKNHRDNGLFRVIELTPAIFKSAEFVLQASSTALRTLDAIHLGITHELKLELFTFDQVLLKSAEKLKIRLTEW
ncbi:MAG: type II toxin-antitoxin system VapC family toxin [Balneolaceae bacterium]|nr:type II toxin-antitoxin system VapC family toxin [Balneolaceae bacterium]